MLSATLNGAWHVDHLKVVKTPIKLMALYFFFLLAHTSTQASNLDSCVLHINTGVGYTAGGDYFGKKNVQVVISTNYM